MSDSTCYIERSEVRQILIGVADEDVEAAESFLAEIDKLPIITGAELASTRFTFTAFREENNYLVQAIRDACDLLAERKYGSPARSPGHNARLVLDAALGHQQTEGKTNVP